VYLPLGESTNTAAGKVSRWGYSLCVLSVSHLRATVTITPSSHHDRNEVRAAAASQCSQAAGQARYEWVTGANIGPQMRDAVERRIRPAIVRGGININANTVPENAPTNLISRLSGIIIDGSRASNAPSEALAYNDKPKKHTESKHCEEHIHGLLLELQC